MKSIKIKTLNDLDLNELRNVLKFCSVLFKLNIKEIEDIENSVHDEITENYCSECKSMHDCCECRGDRDYEPDEDAIYDRWKDQQLMDEEQCLAR